MANVKSFNINGIDSSINLASDTENGLMSYISYNMIDNLEQDVNDLVKDSRGDFDIADSNGYIVLRVEDGHIKTKEFDSSLLKINIQDGTNIHGHDLDISDSRGYNIISFGDGHIRTKNFNSADVSSYIKDLYNSEYLITMLYDDVGIQRTSLPLTNLLTGNSYMMCLQNWGIIGDSFTSGHQDIYTIDGLQSDANPRNAISWAGKMCAINHIDGAYFTRSGQTCKNFIKSQESYNWGVVGTDTTMACNNPRQAYIICLGINDANNAVYTNGYGTVSDSVDFADYTLNDEDAIYGCYFGIIQRIKSIQPKARIFVTSTKEWGTTTMNEVIQSAANNFTHTYYIDTYNYQKHFDYMFSSHPNQLGHVYFAYAMTTLIDKSIRDNFEDFIDSYAIGNQMDGYISGSCYQVNITVKDLDGNASPDEYIAIYDSSKFDRAIVTDDNGIASVVLQNGDYVISPIKTKTFSTDSFTVNSSTLEVETIISDI